MTAVIDGERVFLRLPKKIDEEEFLALNRRSASFNRGLASPATTPEQFAALLERSRKDSEVCFFICRKEDGAIVGSINLSQIFRGGFQNAYLGYQIGADFAGKGY